MSRSERFVCPKCSAVWQKPLHFMTAGIVASSHSTITCPNCSASLALGDVLNGKYDPPSEVPAPRAPELPIVQIGGQKLGLFEILVFVISLLIIGGVLFMAVYRSFVPAPDSVPMEVAPAPAPEAKPSVRPAP